MTALGDHVGAVTGAASGIGRAIATALGAAGAAVGVLDIDEAGARAVADAIMASGGRALALACDVTDEAAVEAAMARLGDAFGPVDILVNNAGVVGNNRAVEAIDRAAYDRVFDVHVRGALHAVRATIAGMKAKGWGRIVSISSNRAQVGFERSSHYSAAKAALVGFSKSWAREFAPFGITVNAIAPGVVRTAMTLSYGEEALIAEAQLNLMRRWAEPEEIARSALFLVGPGGDYMTGQVMCPNGGDPIVGI